MQVAIIIIFPLASCSLASVERWRRIGIAGAQKTIGLIALEAKLWHVVMICDVIYAVA